MLKYKVDILQSLKNVGYSSYRLRREKIFGESTLQKIRTGSTNLSLESLGQICALLHCQPGDLIESIEDEL